ncbi:probable ribonuclease ZC3H12C [Trichonephila inaurata madagascariensis]|uniref:Probable ribonuclease ZC3H12C n=1 Tax=Trichonephila inaurata madagascariensis TaxID=2747483 RepID=A0A8X6XT16_9ARAC|nr:probable ribonuclease ZC3H12C [Trichonephila inaurata madagascariensis]
MPPAPSFIPLSSAEQIDILEPVEKEQRFLRPIVIDGTNVALEHGKHKNTFSCRGLKIAIDYFLQKGHENVTAFVPLHRLERKNYYPFATDHFLLEELEKLGRVVCTPSRIVNDRRVTCYEGRFIVDLATLTGGVIVSNDKYRDLVEESEAYKKTIEKRLLIFCFDGDDFLIPKDPLGVNGPGVDEFLSMSATEKNLFSSAQPQ